MTVFTYRYEDFEILAQDVLQIAKNKGASATAVEFSEGQGLSVTTRQQQVETIEQNKDKGMSVTIYLGGCGTIRRGSASTSDFSTTALRDTVNAAYDIARFTAQDTCAGLPDIDRLEMQPRDLQLYSPWEITTEKAVAIAKAMEKAAFDVDPCIVNSEGASVSVHHGHFVSVNSFGFTGGYPFSRHTLAISPIASNGHSMQRDDWYCSARSKKNLASPQAIGRYAAQRALSRLGARKLRTQKCPVLFEAPLAAGLLGTFVQAISGGLLYRGSTFLLDCLGQCVFAPHIHIKEDPHILGGIGSAPFDDEGVKTCVRDVVTAGIVQGYFLSTYTARKLNMQTTGNAGGSHHLKFMSTLTNPRDHFKAMLKKMHTGLLVTELMGDGVNLLTGDYSRGASGYWVENGDIQYPVEEVTIAGNLRDMFHHIVAIGADTLIRGTKETGSVLVEAMTVGGH